MRRIRRYLRALLAFVAKLVFRGNAVVCPNCRSSFRRFRKRTAPNRECWTCGSLERHRLVKLFMELRPGLLPSSGRLLHIAPERSLRPMFASLPDVEYIAGDLDAYAPDLVHIDVTELQFPDGHFDVVVCNHVLEHVPDDRKAMCEIARVLKPGGWALLLVPDVKAEGTDEDPSVIDSDERRRRFGQWDHVRRYGWDYVDRLCSAGLAVEVVALGDVLEPSVVQRHRLKKFGEIEPLFIARLAPAAVVVS